MCQNYSSFRDTSLKSLVDVIIHLIYLIFFYTFSYIFGSMEYINKSIVSTFSGDTMHGLTIAIVVTLALIGATFCIAILFDKKITQPNLEITKTFFQFGVDYLYFIFITVSVLCFITFFLGIPKEKYYLLTLLTGVMTLSISLFLRFLYHSFEIKHLTFSSPTETQETVKD